MVEARRDSFRPGRRAAIARIVIGVLMLVVVVGGTAISLGTAELLQTVADEWHGQRKLSEHKGQMLARIRQHMGYGGMIHHFKNFVLRKDPALLSKIQGNLKELNTTFSEISKTRLTGDEIEALAKLQKIVEQYALNLAIAIRASQESWTAERTDSHVRVDDGPAYEALQILHNTWFAEFKEDTIRFEAVIAEGIYGLRITTAFIPLLVISGFVILWFTQRLTREIAIRKQAEHKLLLAETVFDSISEAAMVTNASNEIIVVNPAFSAITGYQPEEVIGNNPRMLASGQHDAAFYQDMWAHLTEHGSWQGEIWNRRRSGQIYPERLSIVKSPTSEAGLGEYIAIFTDITDQKAKEDHILHMAHHDRLTGLPNRTLFNDRLDIAIKASTRQKTGVTVMFIDLDGFKAVNDTLGHAAGDDLLCQVTARFNACVRSADTLSRFGGDEFAIVLASVTDRIGGERVAEKLLQSLHEPFLVEGKEASVGASIGMAIFPDDGASPEEIIGQADAAMYAVKNSGKNGYRYANELAKTEDR